MISRTVPLLALIFQPFKEEQGRNVPVRTCVPEKVENIVILKGNKLKYMYIYHAIRDTW